MRLARLYLAVAVVASWFIVAPAKSYACSCVRQTAAEAFDWSSAVFTATVTDIHAPRFDLGGNNPLNVTFQVDRAWKGPSAATLKATTPRDSASCGYEFEVGRQYLVYARGEGSELEVSLCSRTAPLADAAVDLASLGLGTPPEPASSGKLQWGSCSAATSPGPGGLDIALVGVAIGLVGLGLRRRFR